MWKCLIPVLTLFFVSPAFSSEECTTKHDIVVANPPDSTFDELNADQIADLKRNIPSISDDVKSVVVGHLPNNDEDVFLFGFTAAGCEDGSGHTSQQKLDSMIGAPS